MKEFFAEYHNDEITKDVIDSLGVGDIFKINCWDIEMTVKGISANYIIASNGERYTIISKTKGTAKMNYNGRDYSNKYYCAADDWIFGHPDKIDYPDIYIFNTKESVDVYLNSLEKGETRMSVRNREPINILYVKHLKV